MADDDDIPPPPPPEHLDGALLISFGAVHPGREAPALQTFRELVRYLGQLVADRVVARWEPLFFADGLMGDLLGFILVEGRRPELDALRRNDEFERHIMRIAATTQNVRVHTMLAGPEAGRLVNQLREVHTELGFL